MYSDLDLLREQFEQSWGSDAAPTIEEMLSRVPEPMRDALLQELLYVDIEFRNRKCGSCEIEEYLKRFPNKHELIHEIAKEIKGYTVHKHTQVGGCTILEEIGRGGMGIVYRARQMLLNQIVAVKVIRKQLLEHKEAVARFLQEVEAMGKLKRQRHPNIVDVQHAGIHDDQTPFLVMEFVEGTSVDKFAKEYFAQNPKKIGSSEHFQQMTEIVLGAAKGLSSIHEVGLVHRDIKPSNLMRQPDGTIKILDLGLVKLLEPIAGSSSHTIFGAMLGTPHYIAPEQLSNAAAVDIRADIYSLGATFYELLYGQKITENKTVRLHITLPKKLKAILDKMLQSAPGDRYQTPKTLINDLEAFRTASFGYFRWAIIAIFFMAFFIAIIIGEPFAERTTREPFALQTEKEEQTRNEQGDDSLMISHQFAEAMSVAATDDLQPLRNFVEQFELDSSRIMPEQKNADMRLSALEYLIQNDRKNSNKALEEDLRLLDAILLFPFNDTATACYLNRYFDLAIRSCDSNDLSRLTRYIRRSRPQASNSSTHNAEKRFDESTLILLYFSPREENGFAIYYPKEREAARRFAIPLSRAKIKDAIAKGESFSLDAELVRLIREARANGTPLILSWDDTSSWSRHRDAFTNNDWPFGQSITIEEILGSMK